MAYGLANNPIPTHKLIILMIKSLFDNVSLGCMITQEFSLGKLGSKLAVQRPLKFGIHWINIPRDTAI